MIRQLSGSAFAVLLFFTACSDDARPLPRAETKLSPAACRPPQAPPAFRLTSAFPGVRFDRPLSIARSGAQYFVAEQGGQVRRVHQDGGEWRSDLFLDIASELAPPHGEGGLVGFVPSPSFEVSGEVFATYTAQSSTALFRTVLGRFTSLDGGYTADLANQEVVLEIDRDIVGHNGGRLVFGPDGMLYVGIGDGSWGDPELRAQSPYSLLGKILRLDVLGARPYATPPDNPFATGGGRSEVYALGFRNPWSFSFDDVGRLWLGDVGHERWEEIDLVTKGGNYGWPIREGRHCFLASPCDVADAIEPIHEYSHVDGFSVTGGLVYRGQRLGLPGVYVFGDFITGRIWAMETEEPRKTRLLFDSGTLIAGFGEDEAGELLVVDYAGQVLRLEPAGTIEPAQVSLRELGCLGSGSAMDPSLVPYEVNAELWSDGLDKQRWVGLPSRGSIHVTDDGRFELPPGAMLLKEFSSHGRRIETRMFVHDAAFGWQGYTFEWNEAQDDAVLLHESKTVDVDGSPWTIPSRAQCFACHVASVGRVLGFQPAQLNRGLAEHNQLTTLARLDAFDRALDPNAMPALPDPYDPNVPVEPRARAYLHANCSFCHGSTSQSLLDLRASAPLAAMNLVCRHVNFRALGDDGSELPPLVAPGDPTRSVLVARMGAGDDFRMPPLGTGRVDHAGTDLVSAWITSLDHCPE